ncbi:TetR/AcrR family transcriptional regulator [Pseudoruegeria sp. HB172150]|uniref:TetR/AcrR family transcriptional regulator n=1 Tax=Pseudoruegeria sp. HB172150 TaxID=2721164 RepID=UPI0015526947|nr:TetR/AcrR family transcriptional regulator [Pseudoruegeria sp. HB172150]
MPRPKSHTQEDLTERALKTFWRAGYEATSMDDLVTATGVSRHGIYSAFGGKRELFLACFPRYRELVVRPAFSAVEEPGAGLAEIAGYFEHQISAAEAQGLPGPGCFVANSATEVAPHDAEVLAAVAAHNGRLQRGFAEALRTAGEPEGEVEAVAATVVTFATGLWSLSRVVEDADVLRRSVATFMDMLKGRVR